MFETIDNFLRFLQKIVLWAIGVVGGGLAIFQGVRTRSVAQFVGILALTILFVVVWRSIF